MPTETSTTPNPEEANDQPYEKPTFAEMLRRYDAGEIDAIQLLMVDLQWRKEHNMWTPDSAREEAERKLARSRWGDPRRHVQMVEEWGLLLSPHQWILQQGQLAVDQPELPNALQSPEPQPPPPGTRS